MKVAVATESGQVAAHFGHCPSSLFMMLKTISQKQVVTSPPHQPGLLPRF